MDHVGGLPLLLEAYPEVRVVVHADERDYLLGKQHFVAPGSLKAKLLTWAGLMGGPAVPAKRVRTLDEPMGLLTIYGGTDMAYIIAPGHSPGHVI